MAKYYQPRVDTYAFNCPHCGVYAKQDWYSTVVYGNAYKDNPNDIYNRTILEDMKVSKCAHCNNIVIWFRENMLIPRRTVVQEPPGDVPDNIKEIYIEAGNIFNDSPRASGALIRIALELLLQSINKNKLGLDKNINELIKSSIPGQLIKALSILRVNGNDIMHTGEIKIFEKKDDVAFLFDLFNMISEEMITRPKKLDEYYRKIPESKRKEIENKK